MAGVSAGGAVAAGAALAGIAAVVAAFEGLNEKERYIFEKRLTSDEPMTLQDIGAHYGVSRERARQLEAALLERMKKYKREEIPDFDLVAEAQRE